MAANSGVLNVGFQLWLNIETSEKFCEPTYRDYKKEELPIYTENNENIWIRVLVGTYK